MTSAGVPRATSIQAMAAQRSGWNGDRRSSTTTMPSGTATRKLSAVSRSVWSAAHSSCGSQPGRPSISGAQNWFIAPSQSSSAGMTPAATAEC